jgi:hypothetical protein
MFAVAASSAAPDRNDELLSIGPVSTGAAGVTGAAGAAGAAAAAGVAGAAGSAAGARVAGAAAAAAGVETEAALVEGAGVGLGYRNGKHQHACMTTQYILETLICGSPPSTP